MGNLPVPASTYFNDFSFDVLEYNVLRNNSVVGTYRGLLNSDDENYISFLMSDQPQISIGDTISTTDGLETFKVRQISYDRYNGKPELLNAHY